VVALAETVQRRRIAGSGEPTLNARQGELIGRVKERTDTPLAVLTNGSLLWMPDVREVLMEADLVLPSLDAGDEGMFETVNRPYEALDFETMAAGSLGGSMHGRAGFPEPEDPRDADIPAPGDLAGWKAADFRLSNRFAHFLHGGDRLRTTRVAIRTDFEDLGGKNSF